MNKKQTTIWAAAALLGLGLLAGCGSDPKPAASEAAAPVSGSAIRLTGTSGEVDLAKPAARVAALEWSFAGDLLALGVTPVGIADDGKAAAMRKLNGGQPLDYASLGERSAPDIEAILASAPDLILGDTDRHTAILDKLRAVAPTLILNSRKGSYDDSLGDFRRIAAAVGREAEGEARLKQHAEAMELLQAKAEKLPVRKVLIGVARKDGLNAHSAFSYAGQVIQRIGLDNVASGSEEEPYPELGLEGIVEADPDAIFIATDDEMPITDQWAKTSVWQGLRAVKAGRVYEVDRDVWTRFRGITPAESIAGEAISRLESVSSQ